MTTTTTTFTPPADAPAAARSILRLLPRLRVGTLEPVTAAWWRWWPR